LIVILSIGTSLGLVQPMVIGKETGRVSPSADMVTIAIDIIQPQMKAISLLVHIVSVVVITVRSRICLLVLMGRMIM
jgi:hypothetical protein